MPRRSTRQLSELLQMASVDDTAIGPQVSDNIQLTYEVSDVSHLVRPIPVRVYGTSDTVPAGGAGVHSGFTFQSGRGGAWLLWYEEATSADRTMIRAGPASDTTRGLGMARALLTGVTDDQGTSRVFRATRIGLYTPAFQVRSTTILTGLPLYIPPGQFFEGLRLADNAILRPSLVWQEIPAGVLPAPG